MEAPEFIRTTRELDDIDGLTRRRGFGNHVDAVAGRKNGIRNCEHAVIGVRTLPVPNIGRHIAQSALENFQIFITGATRRRDDQTAALFLHQIFKLLR